MAFVASKMVSSELNLVIVFTVCQFSAPWLFRGCNSGELWKRDFSKQFRMQQNGFELDIHKKLFMCKIANAGQFWGSIMLPFHSFSSGQNRNGHNVLSFSWKKSETVSFVNDVFVLSWPGREMVGVTRSGLVSSIAGYQWIWSLRNGSLRVRQGSCKTIETENGFGRDNKSSRKLDGSSKSSAAFC